MDGVGLAYGTNVPWSHGGHMSRNLLSSAASDADDPVDVEPWTAITGTGYSRVTTTGTGSEGSKAFRMLYNGASPTISYVAAGTVFSTTSSGTAYTLNKPAGLADGDVLLAYVAANGGHASETLAPAGWVKVNSCDTGGSASTLTVLMKDGLAADPSTWAGNLTSTATRIRAVVLAYRGAAPAVSQFDAEGVRGILSGATALTTTSVTNAVANAWRLSAFAVRDNVTGGTVTANIQPPAAGGISFVGNSSVWKTTSSGSAYTIYRPAGVVSGDFMLATLTANGTITPTAPSGWTIVRTTTSTANGSTITSTILKRTAGGSEPTSWAGTHTGSAVVKITGCVAYRNVADASLQFIAENGASRAQPSPSVTNTDSSAWRVAVVANSTDNGDYISVASGGGVLRMEEDSNQAPGRDCGYTFFDSGATIATGSTSQGFSMTGESVYTWASWTGVLKPLTSLPAAPANETERTDGTTGASDPWLTLAVYDSAAAAATGPSQSVTGSFTVGSGSNTVSAATWIGYLKPLALANSGEAGVTLADYVDISSVDQAVLDRSDGKVTVQASLLGSTSGSAVLALYSYVGNELIATDLADGAAFNTSIWAKSAATFTLREGTTRLKMGILVRDRIATDIVYYDRTSIAFGIGTVWRRGTGRTAHPIFNVPVIEYREDRGDGCGSDWTPLPGTSKAQLKYDQLTGLCTFEDQTIVPLTARQYRAKTISYGLAGDMFVSAYGPESDEITVQASEWWLKDVEDPANSMQLKVKLDPLDVGVTNTAAVFQPLGSSTPVVLTEGYKGDVIQITVQVRRLEYQRLRDLLNSGKTLFLQSNMDDAWWVRPVGDMGAATQLTSYADRTADPLRFVKLTFAQVAPEA